MNNYINIYKPCYTINPRILGVTSRPGTPDFEARRDDLHPENMGRFGRSVSNKNSGKTMEKQWKNHGKTMEKPWNTWQNHGKTNINISGVDDLYH